MRLQAVVNEKGEDITEIVMSGEYMLSKEASECVEGILSRIRKGASTSKVAEKKI